MRGFGRRVSRWWSTWAAFNVRGVVLEQVQVNNVSQQVRYVHGAPFRDVYIALLVALRAIRSVRTLYSLSPAMLTDAERTTAHLASLVSKRHRDI